VKFEELDGAEEGTIEAGSSTFLSSCFIYEGGSGADGDLFSV